MVVHVNLCKSGYKFVEKRDQTIYFFFWGILFCFSLNLFYTAEYGFVLLRLRFDSSDEKANKDLLGGLSFNAKQNVFTG